MSRIKRAIPIKYQLYLDNNNINNFIWYNNSIMISNNSKGSNETKTKIIKFENKFDFKNIETERDKIINFKNLSIIKAKKRALKKTTISKQLYLNYSPKIHNNFIYII